MVGLMNRKSISEQEALIITHCQSIHMVFMRFSMDVLFLDKKNYVVGLVEGIRPFQFSPLFFKASYAIELAEGVIAKSQTALGDEIELK